MAMPAQFMKKVAGKGMPVSTGPSGKASPKRMKPSGGKTISDMPMKGKSAPGKKAPAKAGVNPRPSFG
jgi:hypothetical protein